MDPKRTVVFVCLHGSGKSLMAAEYFKRLAAQRHLAVEATSAGTDPDSEVPASVLAGLRADGIYIQDYRPRRVTREELAAAWRVIAFGCDLTTLAPRGYPIERWDDVPPASESFAAARDRILTRLEWLLEGCSPSPPLEAQRRTEADSITAFDDLEVRGVPTGG